MMRVGSYFFGFALFALANIVLVYGNGVCDCTCGNEANLTFDASNPDAGTLGRLIKTNFHYVDIFYPKANSAEPS